MSHVVHLRSEMKEIAKTNLNVVFVATHKEFMQYQSHPVAVSVLHSMNFEHKAVFLRHV